MADPEKHSSPQNRSNVVESNGQITPPSPGTPTPNDGAFIWPSTGNLKAIQKSSNKNEPQAALDDDTKASEGTSSTSLSENGQPIKGPQSIDFQCDHHNGKDSNDLGSLETTAANGTNTRDGLSHSEQGGGKQSLGAQPAENQAHPGLSAGSPNYTSIYGAPGTKAIDWAAPPSSALSQSPGIIVTSPTPSVASLETLGSHGPCIKYLTNRLLGHGSFGAVYEAINVDSGEVMAVKVLHQPGSTSHGRDTFQTAVDYAFKREVEMMSRLNHPNIIDFIGSQGWDTMKIEIFMGLKEGSVESLLARKDGSELAGLILQHMLQALDHLDFHGIVHRDVKPPNILYSRNHPLMPGTRYCFQLGDFGICNHTSNMPKTAVGTMVYMAPEQISETWHQTPKIDVWALFVTMMWVLDVEGFRNKERKGLVPAGTVVFDAQNGRLTKLKEMGHRHPRARAAAAQMLVKLGKTSGLTTPQHRIPPLGSNIRKVSFWGLFWKGLSKLCFV